jgi:hypothetical protein
MNSKILKLAASALTLLVAFGVSDSVNAQRRREARNRMMTKAQVKAVIDRVENRVDNFVKNYDRSLDRSRLNDTNGEDRLNNRARDLESATDELAREFDRRDTWAENRDEVRKCLNIASDIDRNMRNRKLGRETEQNWANVRFELNTLADIYNMPKVGAAAYR